MKRQRNIRKKFDEDEDEDEEKREKEFQDTISSSSSKNSNKSKLNLTFKDDLDENEGEEEFRIKKSKESRRMRQRVQQAPNIYDIDQNHMNNNGKNMNSNDDERSTIRYDQESLKELRESQNFKIKQIEDNVIKEIETLDNVSHEVEVIELSGDLVEELIDNGDESKNNRNNFNKDGNIIINTEIIQSLKSTIQIPLSSINHHSNFEDNVEDQSNEMLWEESLAKRAGIIQFPKKSITVDITTSLSSVKKSLERTLQHLTNSCSKISKEYNVSQSMLSSLKEEQTETKTLFETKSNQFKFMNTFRLYVSDVVGMLRAKESMIQEYQTAIFEYFEKYLQVSIEKILEKQEYELNELNQSGFINSLGGYNPQKFEKSSELFQINVLVDQQRFQTAAIVILQDVRPDISNLQNLMLKFTQFRKENYIKYQEMYIDLSLPQLVEPFIILDLLPSFFQLLQDDCQTFDLTSRPWYDFLYEYSIENIPQTNNDNKIKESTKELLPTVMNVTVLPLITTLMVKFFNPFNRRHISICDQIIQQLLDFDPETNQINSLMNTLLIKFQYFSTFICFPNINLNSPIIISFISNQLSQLNLLFENLSILSKYFSLWKTGNICWKFLHDNCDSMIKFLEIINEIWCYNSIASYYQIILKLIPNTEMIQKAIQDQNFESIEFPLHFHSMINEVALLDISLDFNRVHFIKCFQSISTFKKK